MRFRFDNHVAQRFANFLDFKVGVGIYALQLVTHHHISLMPLYKLNFSSEVTMGIFSDMA